MNQPPHPITLEYNQRYKKLKIEKLGDTALQLVLNGVRKGRSYREIAKMLEESFEKKVTHKDVSAVMNVNAKLMVEYQKFLQDHKFIRANMILDESKVLVEDMEKLDEVFNELSERSKKAISTKDFIEITKGMTDLSRTRALMIKNFKKLTGQFKEGPSIIIDQSTKEVNITTDSQGSSKLAKELAKAEFKSNVKIEGGEENPTPPEKEDVVDAEFEVEDKVVPDSEINTQEKADEVADKKVEENKGDDVQ